MNTSRLYSLPNCVLKLDGLPAAGSFGDSRPAVSVLLGARCSFPAHGQEFECDRTFFEHFARVVSLYAQEVLSGLRSPELRATDVLPHQRAGIEQAPIELRRATKPHHHHLIVRPPALEGSPPPETVNLELTTLQLYDLVETIDQFYTDTKTLPDVTLQLAPVSRRYRDADQPIVQRALPVAAGAASLAIAAGVLVMLPMPKKIEPPKDILRDKNQLNHGSKRQRPDQPPSPEPSSPQPSSPQPSSALPGAGPAIALTPLQQYVQGKPQPPSSPTVSGSGSLAAPVTPVTSITTEAISTKLQAAWQPSQTGLPHPVHYQVSIDRQGQILGYRALQPADQTWVDRLPLRSLLVNPLTRKSTQEPLLSFRVTFDPSGEVSARPL